MVSFKGLALLTSAFSLTTAQPQSSTPSSSSNAATYTNPILPSGADPWMTKYDGYYYMTYTTMTNITILRSRNLVDWNDAESKLAFDPPPGEDYSTNLWAPVRFTKTFRRAESY